MIPHYLSKGKRRQRGEKKKGRPPILPQIIDLPKAARVRSKCNPRS
uniref:Uncharacterized protein n=1 Tax=Rhizophora mucronata TaxID=61149 RepID=A0A2P2QK14_RHIMU